jgi:hypothetical protein
MTTMPLIVPLPVPLRDCALIEVEEVVQHHGLSALALRFWGGNLDAEGVFVRDPDLRRQEIVLKDGEYPRFLAWAASRGAEPGNWRYDDLLKFAWAQEARSRGIPVEGEDYPPPPPEPDDPADMVPGEEPEDDTPDEENEP